MPAKNRIKQYVKSGYYHIYNRGVAKREIFRDAQDYNTFLSYLKEYLSFRDETSLRTSLADQNISWVEKDKILKVLHLNNFSETIELLCFTLMPNHFHFLLKQLDEYSLAKFMASLSTRFSMYFNRKYKRVGPLFQDIYKAVLIET
ncbi:MAG: transposase, partial [Candidatus Cloacimonetes bacterium]|nr:transposase [Candidatus Cloacimonadota bacterium]